MPALTAHVHGEVVTSSAEVKRFRATVGAIKSSPQRIIAEGTDLRFLNELRRELKAQRPNLRADSGFGCIWTEWTADRSIVSFPSVYRPAFERSLWRLGACADLRLLIDRRLAPKGARSSAADFDPLDRCILRRAGSAPGPSHIRSGIASL